MNDERPEPGTEARVSELPMCDFCKDEFKARPASYDGRTAFGWAYMCDDHFAEEGPSKLGTGIAQRLVLVDNDAIEDAADAALEQDSTYVTYESIMEDSLNGATP